MDFLPHTPEDVAEMLAASGFEDIDALFASIPAEVKLGRALDVPPALSEPELAAHMAELAARSAHGSDLVCFAGGGAYDHHVPAAVGALAGRAEFATSYTPYQPELSQGVLQAVFEFQSLVCEIYGMDVANASLYDGANALVEGVNLAVRATKRERVLVSAGVHPHYRDVLKTYTSGLGLDIHELGHDDTGALDPGTVDPTGAAAVVVAYPNFFGRLEDVRTLADRAHEAGALLVCVTDPTAMGILRSPGEMGADVAVGEGQSLGNLLSYGGPYVGLFATKLELVRQVPGRIAGETVDADGRRAFVLTLQAREQHIRRAKATSNVCTNQTLMAIAAAVHLSWLGPQGLARLGEVCARRTAAAARRLAEIPGCKIRFEGPHFKEIVLQTPLDAATLTRALSARGFLVGPPLGTWYPDLENCLLVAVTEKRTSAEIDALAEAIEKELAQQ
ncbi:MAG TPA: aminomethyl-transferring glycine dehydrogenase subunit GcvPA [Actinomycetota bacterium]|nr:aminomethyl-transferring glycine dehydrogenase subunit GcvPA [Actinomycetota bacterium]